MVDETETRKRFLMTDKELLAVDANPEFERLDKWIYPADPFAKPEIKAHRLRPVISMLAVRRAVAKAQLKKVRKGNTDA